MDLKFGNKRLCGACGAVFFDMNHVRPKCPKCDEIFVFSSGLNKFCKQKPFVKEKEPRSDIDDLRSKDNIDLSDDLIFEDSKDLDIIENI